MNKEDFIAKLKECLEGEVPVSEYRDSLSYYQEYFREQEMNGRTEQEILEELGDPRLIAHSIIDAHGIDNEVTHAGGYYDEYTDSYRDSGEEIVNDPQPGPVDNLFHSIGKVLVIVAILLAAGVLLNILLPVILVIVVVLLFMGLFRR